MKSDTRRKLCLDSIRVWNMSKTQEYTRIIESME